MRQLSTLVIIDFAVSAINNTFMKPATVELAVKTWPYGLEIRPAANGVLLTPRRKARAGWSKAFGRSRARKDELAPARQISNAFDAKEWEW
ncbi:MAG: hypothetical protein ACHRHE_07760 [Tepidisphaerales bacterium]